MDIADTVNIERCRHFENMGIEPTGNALNGDALSEMFRGKSVSLKSALLDQKLVAGLGNIMCVRLFGEQGYLQSGQRLPSAAKTVRQRGGVMLWPGTYGRNKRSN